MTELNNDGYNLQVCYEYDEYRPIETLYGASTTRKRAVDADGGARWLPPVPVTAPGGGRCICLMRCAHVARWPRRAAAAGPGERNARAQSDSLTIRAVRVMDEFQFAYQYNR